MSNSPRKPKPADVLSTLRSKRPNRVTVPMVFDTDARNELVNARRRARVMLNAYDAAELMAGDAGNPDDEAEAAANLETSRLALEEADTRLSDAEAAAAPHTVEFVFEALGSVRMAELRAEHAPTRTQRDEFRNEAKAAGLPKSRWAGPEWNPDTYPLALTYATLVEPDLDEEQFLELVWQNDAFTEAELGQLFAGAWRACTETGAMPDK